LLSWSSLKPPSDLCDSRIHISKAALDNLDDAYEVEPRHAPENLADRDPFLVDNNIDTFLIVRKVKQAANAKTSVPTTPTTVQVPISPKVSNMVYIFFY
jgi:hypothetical protein